MKIIIKEYAFTVYANFEAAPSAATFDVYDRDGVKVVSNEPMTADPTDQEPYRYSGSYQTDDTWTEGVYTVIVEGVSGIYTGGIRGYFKIDKPV